MDNKIAFKLTTAVLLLNIAVPSTASAITLTGKCYVNATRSRITAAVSGQSGSYFITIFSGENVKSSKIRTTSINNIVSFAFDSESLVYTAGRAVAITPSFIKNNNVIIRFRDGPSSRLLGAVGPVCQPI